MRHPRDTWRFFIHSVSISRTGSPSASPAASQQHYPHPIRPRGGPDDTQSPSVAQQSPATGPTLPESVTQNSASTTVGTSEADTAMETEMDSAGLSANSTRTVLIEAATRYRPRCANATLQDIFRSRSPQFHLRSFNCLICHKNSALPPTARILFIVDSCARATGAPPSACYGENRSGEVRYKNMYAAHIKIERRFLGFDAGDWSIVLLGIALAGSLLLALI